METWMSPMNRVIWIKAFRKKDKQVTIRDERKFNIEYLDNTELFGEKTDWVLVTPVKGFAPSGFFRLKTVKDQIWLTESNEPAGKESLYMQYLDQFMQSGMDGVEVTEEWPDLSNRLATTIRQGFQTAKNARGMRADNVIITSSGGKVFLVKGKS